MKRILALTLLATLALSACNGGDDSKEDSSLLDSILGGEVHESDGTDEDGDLPYSEGPQGLPTDYE